MSNLFSSSVGGVVSADIAVPEHERVLRFYARVLTTGDAPFWRDDLMNAQGTPVIGLGQRTPEMEALPLQWMPHVQVADVAASAATAVRRGGRELMHGKDEQGQSQWAVLVDPDGAAFGVIPVVPAEALPSVAADARVGHIAGLDLTVADAAAARDFYREVVGWTAADDEGSEIDVAMLAEDGRAVATIRHARDADRHVPAVWLLHLPVGDLDESLRRVAEEGGRVVHETTGSDGRRTHATVEDPVGVMVTLTAG